MSENTDLSIAPTPIIMREEPPDCIDCGKPLRFAFELENGNLCSTCGPGSTKYAEKQTVSFKNRALKEQQARERAAKGEAPVIEVEAKPAPMSTDEYITKMRIAGSDLCLKVRMVLTDQSEANLKLLFESVSTFEPFTA